jgi:PAS domain S-box-containing protein
MSAQYRFSLIQVLRLFTLAAGVIVIVMACLAMASWIIGGRGFLPQFLNQPGPGSVGITPDAALCFILCGISLWVLRESTGNGGTPPPVKTPAEKFLFESALVRSSLIKVPDDEDEVSDTASRAAPPQLDETERGSPEGKNLAPGARARVYSRRIAQLSASTAAAIAVAELAGYLFGWGSSLASVGGWLSQVGAATGYGSVIAGLSIRMAPSAAFAFLLNGIALTMLDIETRRGSRPAQHLALIALFLSLVVALGHAYQTPVLHYFLAARGWPEMTGLMAIIFVALSFGVVCARPRSGLVSLLTSEGAGGYMARRLLPLAILVPVGLGYLGSFGAKAGYFDSSLVTPLLVLTLIPFFLSLVWRGAARLRNLDTERELAEEALYKGYSDLQKRVDEQTAELMRANQDLWAEMIERECIELDMVVRKEAEARLLESEAGFRLAVNSAPVMIWMSDADKVCTFFNKGWRDYTGRAVEQKVENGWAESVHPDDSERCLETYIEAFDDRREFKMEYRLRRHDGEYRWVLTHGAPHFISNGNDGDAEAEESLAGYISACVDIHERKEYEEALRASEEFSRSVLECSADRIEALDLDGRLMSVNRRGMKIMEIDDFSAYAAAVWADLWEDESRTAARSAIETAKAGGEGRFIGSGKTAKGALKWWEAIVSPALDPHGKPEFLVAILRDMTEVRQIERERDDLLLRERAVRMQAEEVNRLKDEFLATVSHELRAPLNAIQGWVKLLRDGRLDPDETARALETIERSTRAQNRIVSDLLDVSRIITGKLSLNVSPIQPAAVIESAVESLRPAADAKEIGIELVLDHDAGPISGDSGRLRQVIWNLVSNAIKFTPKQGRVQVRLERAGESIDIAVSDTGVGIAPDFLPFVFDRFRQGDGSSTRRQGGLGLGLAIVRHLTEMHGGSVRAHSPGTDQGATFVVKLPLITETQVSNTTNATYTTNETNETNEANEANETNETYMSHKSHKSLISPTPDIDVLDQTLELDGLRVLAVDDDSDARDLIRTILTQYGAIVETACSADQALAVFERPEEWQPELLISDIEMPEADGYQLIRKLREIESQRGRRVPAIALTAYARAEDRLRSLAAGFQIHVTKPVEPVELLTIVASLTGRLSRSRSLYEVGEMVRQEAG